MLAVFSAGSAETPDKVKAAQYEACYTLSKEHAFLCAKNDCHSYAEATLNKIKENKGFYANLKNSGTIGDACQTACNNVKSGK